MTSRILFIFTQLTVLAPRDTGLVPNYTSSWSRKLSDVRPVKCLYYATKLIDFPSWAWPDLSVFKDGPRLTIVPWGIQWNGHISQTYICKRCMWTQHLLSPGKLQRDRPQPGYRYLGAIGCGWCPRNLLLLFFRSEQWRINISLISMSSMHPHAAIYS